MLLLHVGMCIRLSEVLAPERGLVNDKLGNVVAVQLHEHDQRRLDNLTPGYCLFIPEYMAQGVWMQVLSYKSSPWAAHIRSEASEDEDAETEEESMAGSLIFIENDQRRVQDQRQDR